jgi:NADP-dependent 3-hydroxy acid dehydrogenase YdfG
MSNFPPATVVVTGASAGVGRAIAHRFARAGWTIGLIARDQHALEQVKREVEELGGTGVVFPLDVTDAPAVFAAADDMVAQCGGIDVWINDAMVTVFSPVWKITPDEYRRVTEVTYLGYVHGTMAALRHMRARNSGTIIQIGSALAYRGIPLQAAYCGAKYAIRGFTDALRTELIHEQSAIKLTMVELPAVNTPQFDWARTHMARQPRPVAPVVQPEFIAEVVFSGAHNPKREYWLGLSTVKAILANMIWPAFLDRYLARNVYSAQERPTFVSPERRDNLMTPVTALHRTRGSFDDEARQRMIAVSGPVARFVPVLAAVAAGLVVGFVVCSEVRDRRWG